jgi:hypothetical protein
MLPFFRLEIVGGGPQYRPPQAVALAGTVRSRAGIVPRQHMARRKAGKGVPDDGDGSPVIPEARPLDGC